MLTSTGVLLHADGQYDAGSFHPNYNDSTIAIEFPTAVIGATCTKGPGTASVPVIKTIIHPKYNGVLPFLNSGDKPCDAFLI